MSSSLAIHLVDKSMIASLHKVAEQQHIQLSQELIPADFFIDAREQHLPDTVFKYLIYLLYSKLTPHQFLQAVETVIRDDIIPQVNQNLGHYSTLAEALEQHVMSASQLMSGTHLDSKILGNETWLTQPAESHKIWNEPVEIFSIIFLRLMVESFIGKSRKVEKLALSTPEQPVILSEPEFKHCSAFLGRSVTGIALPNELLHQKVQSNTRESQIQFDHTKNPFLIRFRIALSPYVNFGRVPIELACELLDVGARTLQRMLAAESTSYRAELDYLIFEKVKRLLKQTDFSVTDIAYQFNYTDSSNFARAFKRYVGVSPLEYRRVS
ncbi:helix-turn-helix transcriptional regulator [Vibrio breoganii]|uniref:helix-turn-helix transcriptional regulator n=1 Tax=Vibrio breoganii TaxID=553239 RepID=UPI0021C3F503|nr:helix-turn-helix transcriptional regulator [Vibrio breoganii]MDN3716760.1 helix-turn-helix transcriptional regulator [Vibrio breoganii]